MIPNGLTQLRTRTSADRYVTTAPDGTITTVQMAADPRFGMRSSYPELVTIKLLSGLTRTETATRSAVIPLAGDPFSATSWTASHTLNGRTSTTSYNFATRVETTTTPAGRTVSRLFDAQGKLVQIDPPDDASIFFSYDTQGRLLSTAQGTRSTVRSYGADGLLASVSDPLDQLTSFARNVRGDVLSETRPDLEVMAFGYDGEGHTTAVTPPGKPTHAMTYNAIEEMGGYAPPAIAQGNTETQYTYDLDRKLDLVQQPGPRAVDYSYDFAGRLSAVTFPSGSISRTYSPTTGRVSSVTGPSGVTLSMTYDGALRKSVTFSGSVNGTVAWSHDTDFRVINETVNGAWPAAFSFDPDSLLLSANGLTLTRDPDSGRITSSTGGNVVETRSYSEYGELSALATTVSGSPLLSFSYVRDDLGRITEKTENGVVTAYGYDAAGRLTTVTEDGDLVESYAYDPNGNRISSLNASGTFAATVDDQDRLESYGNLVFSYTLNGELLNKTNAATNESWDHEYDAVGNLREVVLPNGDIVSYLVDGQGRRVGKLYNGVLERAWLWRGALQPVAELDGAGNVVARFVYAEGVNVPELMVTATATYRLVKDHLGSVRQVVDVASSVIAQEIAYDAWGRVLLDTAPGFQPFGFAGGLYDPDTGLVRFGARDYDAQVGRWTAKDLVGVQWAPHRFEYGNSNPTTFIDPNGRYAIPALLFFGWRVYAVVSAGRRVVSYNVPIGALVDLPTSDGATEWGTDDAALFEQLQRSHWDEAQEQIRTTGKADAFAGCHWGVRISCVKCCQEACWRITEPGGADGVCTGSLERDPQDLDDCQDACEAQEC